jgi:PhzF family phenazine biosynthesis protein
MPAALYTVDAFTNVPFTGNPAAVCFAGEASVGWMQALASEIGLSETAFLHPTDGVWSLRWFTPAAEVDLCGHATLASAHILWETERVAPDTDIVFATRSGRLIASRKDEWILLDFPNTQAAQVAEPPGLIDALGVVYKSVWQSRFDYMVEVETVDEVVDATPDFGRLASLSARGIILTASGGVCGADFTSRFFAPAVGVFEDPVTGSAHCCLTPFWAERLGKRELYAHQASSRGGFLKVRLVDDRVEIGGQAVSVIGGTVA